MNGPVARSLASSFAKSSPADLALMSLSVALAVFVSASAAGAYRSLAQARDQLEADPSYLELRVLPSALNREAQDAVEALEGSSLGGFMLPADSAAGALAESPSVRYAYSYDLRTFRAGEAVQDQFAAMRQAMGSSRSAMPSGASGFPEAGQAEVAVNQGAKIAMPAPEAFPSSDGAFEGPDGMPPEFMISEPSEEELSEAASFEEPMLESLPGALVDPTFFEAYGAKAAEGSLFSAEEAASGASVLVLGKELAARLFSDGKALGRKIRLDGVSYQIVGILEAMGGADRDWDGIAFAPARDFRMGGGGQAMRWMPMNQVYAAGSVSQVESAAAELQAYFDRTAGEGAVSVLSSKEELDERTRSQNTLLAAAFALAALCVLVALLNLMNASATKALKRRRSLGILRAIGASALDVGASSFWETSIPAGAGLILGVLAAWLFSPTTLSLLTGEEGAASLPLAALGAALAAAALPLLVGTLPAWHAVRSSPADLVRPE